MPVSNVDLGIAMRSSGSRAATLRSVAISCFLACLPCTPAPAAEGSAAALDALFHAYDRDSAPFFPFSASDFGIHEFDSVLPDDLGEAYRSSLGRLCGSYLAKLRGLERGSLDHQRRLSYDIFRHRLESCVEGLKYPWHLLPINQAGFSLPSRFPVMGAGRGAHPFRTVRNYEDFLKRIDGFVVWVNTAISNMRAGAARGITQPRVLMEKVVPQLQAHIVEDPRESLFYEPIRNFPADFDAATREALAAAYLAAIERKILPTYRKLVAFIRDEYLPRCRTTDGFAGLPGGSAMYRNEVRFSTTTDVAPARIYDIGVAEVERITSRITAVRAEIEASGEASPSRYHDADDLVRAYAALRDPVATAVKQLFGRFARSDFEIRAIEAYRERSMSSSYVAPAADGSRIGVFYLNAASAKSERGATVSRSLYLHEVVPGHHMQMSLQRENEELPSFRRAVWYTAYGEGWGLYAERLGDEAGLYRTGHERLDTLQWELLRAARLVVDVGLHEKGWTREQGIDYLVKTVGSPRASAELEVERYMAWPAQALGYKIGEIKLLELRKKAQAALGAAFDIRAFHDEMLRDGAMPLTILEAKMDEWVAQQKFARNRAE